LFRNSEGSRTALATNTVAVYKFADSRELALFLRLLTFAPKSTCKLRQQFSSFRSVVERCQNRSISCNSSCSTNKKRVTIAKFADSYTLYTVLLVSTDCQGVFQVNDDGAGARPVAMTVDLCKNGTTTTTMNLAPVDPASAACDQSAPAPPSVVEPEDKKILYGLDDCPAWYLCIFLGLQVIILVGFCQCLIILNKLATNNTVSQKTSKIVFVVSL